LMRALRFTGMKRRVLRCILAKRLDVFCLFDALIVSLWVFIF
jgi:hypothetical protein